MKEFLTPRLFTPLNSKQMLDYRNFENFEKHSNFHFEKKIVSINEKSLKYKILVL